VARPAKFTDDQVLDGATVAVARYGPAVTIAQIAQQMGAPVGSIYHRFESREHVLVQLWLRSIGRFQAGLLEAAGDPDVERAFLRSALHIPRFCREQPATSLTMTLFRQQRLVQDPPAGLEAAVASVNDAVDAALADLVRRRWGRSTERRYRLAVTAVRQSPYGLVRPYVGVEVPAWLDEVVEASTKAIIDLGD
jgi:AcrR family transcriptional regulator